MRIASSLWCEKVSVWSAEKVSVWSACDFVADHIDHWNIQSQDESRVLGLHVEAKYHEIPIAARSMALLVRWIRCKAGVAPVLRFMELSMVTRDLADHQQHRSPHVSHHGARGQTTRRTWVSWHARVLFRCQTWLKGRHGEPKSCVKQPSIGTSGRRSTPDVPSLGLCAFIRRCTARGTNNHR